LVRVCCYYCMTVKRFCGVHFELGELSLSSNEFTEVWCEASLDINFSGAFMLQNINKMFWTNISGWNCKLVLLRGEGKTRYWCCKGFSLFLSDVCQSFTSMFASVITSNPRLTLLAQDLQRMLIHAKFSYFKYFSIKSTSY